MPVKGVTAKSAKDLHFTWRSYRTIYASLVFVMISMNAVWSALWLFNDRITFIRIGKYRPLNKAFIPKFIGSSIELEL